MSESPRRKSPKAPSMPLDEAVSRAISIYEKEQRHAAPTDVVAQDIGYKNANNGAALSALASLRGYGLLESPEPGKLAVSADVQSFRYAPDEELKDELLRKWLKSPPIFAFLLGKYVENLPPDATIRYDLIQRGFKPNNVESIVKAFKGSVEFAKYYEVRSEADGASSPSPIDPKEDGDLPIGSMPYKRPHAPSNDASIEADRIPVRLDTKRRAWLEIPTPFYEADKDRLKAQIDLLLTDDESGLE